MNPLSWIKDILSALVGAAIMFGLMWLYYEGVPIGPLRYIPGIHYVFPEGKIEREKRIALDGYVLKSELAAEQALRAKAERDMNAANLAAARYAAIMQEAQAREADQIEAEAKRNAAYEQKLKDAGRRCDLDQSDIDWLRGR